MTTINQASSKKQKSTLRAAFASAATGAIGTALGIGAGLGPETFQIVGDHKIAIAGAIMASAAIGGLLHSALSSSTNKLETIQAHAITALVFLYAAAATSTTVLAHMTDKAAQTRAIDPQTLCLHPVR